MTSVLKSSAAILFLFVFCCVSLLHFMSSCDWLMAQIWHRKNLLTVLTRFTQFSCREKND